LEDAILTIAGTTTFVGAVIAAPWETSGAVAGAFAVALVVSDQTLTAALLLEVISDVDAARTGSDLAESSFAVHSACGLPSGPSKSRLKWARMTTFGLIVVMA
jgi:hypothetical protein